MALTAVGPMGPRRAKKKVRRCGRVRIEGDTVVRDRDGVAHYAGLPTCGYIWASRCAPRRFAAFALPIAALPLAAGNQAGQPHDMAASPRPIVPGTSLDEQWPSSPRSACASAADGISAVLARTWRRSARGPSGKSLRRERLASAPHALIYSGGRAAEGLARADYLPAARGVKQWVK